ncbi:MAG: geranylgeranylglyceryl/heptaprenylglyceryl phosphate synthase [Candidatus Marinimicrobia bacterium]|nr:geranylgeranylglyceryl/heptaprenylglyceryl phosphate synthase [Candidatus Neomarinimicrobiota bacterium]
MSVFQTLLGQLDNQSANHLVLIDPDRKNDGRIDGLVASVNESGADAILVGGSLIMDGGFQDRVMAIKTAAKVPVILFPGSATQLSKHADAVLFMSLLSGRNPQYLIGEQVQAAPLLKNLGLEVIPTGYLLMAGGEPTAVEFMSNSQPLPAKKPDIALAHALAAQYLGMALVYLEAGSGAATAVPDEIIRRLAAEVEIPLAVGGGIRTPEEAAAKVKAGARFIVTGSIFESDSGPDTMANIATAVHEA